MAPRIIVFDLDGTLVDTAPDLIGSLNVLFARERLAPIPLDEGRGLIGGGVRKLIESGLALQDRTFTTTEIDLLFADYITHYAEHIADNSRPFAGVEAALDVLAARGNRFAVCTNKLAWLAVRLLDRLDLSARFVAICGRDTFAVEKPDPEILRRTIAAAGGDPADSIMVGDSATDIATARAARVPVIAVDFGYTDVPVAKLDPDRIISHFDALPEAVSALMHSPA